VGEAGRPVTRTLGLLAFPLLFLEIYLLFSVFMALVSGWRLSGIMLARMFILTLVPIAIAYHIAHYLAFLLVQGQRLLPLSSWTKIFMYITVSVLMVPYINRVSAG
jgi:hypothetical protein